MTHSSSDHDRIAERLPLLRRRAAMVQATRKFFDDRGYLDVETPYAVPVPGEEVPVSYTHLTLPTKLL